MNFAFRSAYTASSNPPPCLAVALAKADLSAIFFAPTRVFKSEQVYPASAKTRCRKAFYANLLGVLKTHSDRQIRQFGPDLPRFQSEF